MLKRWVRRERTLLSEYLDGRLAPGEAREFESRAAADPDLKRQLAELGGIRDMVAAMPLEQPRRALALSPAAVTLPARPVRVPPAARVAFGLAAFAAFMFGTASFLVSSDGESSGGMTSADDSTFEASGQASKSLAGDQAGGSAPAVASAVGGTAVRDAEGPVAPGIETRSDADGPAELSDADATGRRLAPWRAVQVVGAVGAFIATAFAAAVLLRTRRETRP